MSKVVNVDVFGGSVDHSLLDIFSSPAGNPVMTAFLNIVKHGSIMSAGNDTHLTRVLDLVASNLDELGTVVVALPDFDFPLRYLKGKQNQSQDLVSILYFF